MLILRYSTIKDNKLLLCCTILSFKQFGHITMTAGISKIKYNVL